jgi:DNA polymerase III subunit gamma/tau
MIIRRDSTTGSNDLNVVYRPCLVDEMLGNVVNKKIIKNALDTGKVPHTQLFVGSAGCGKTTAAKIIALGLNCETKGVGSQPCLECKSCLSIVNNSSIDVKEINVGQSGGKDYIDTLVKDLPTSPFNSRFKVLIFDEAHKLTEPAKDLLLKPIETGFDHVYFIFCTNQPEKLKSKNKSVGEAFLDRCSISTFDRVSDAEINELLTNICEFEGFPFNKDVLDLISSESKGIPRNAIVWLNKVSIEGSWDINVAKEICKVVSDEENPEIIELFRALNGSDWKKSLKLYEGLKKIPAETLRISISGLFVGCLKRAKTMGEGKRYSSILDILSVPIYEVGKPSEHKWYNCMFKIIDTNAYYKGRSK